MPDDSEIASNNPAGRLYHLLKTASEVGKEPQNTTAMDVWAEALGARSTEPMDFYPLFSEACRLPDHIEAAFEKTGVDDFEPFVRYLEGIRRILSPRAEKMKWQQVTGQINPTVLYSLELGARELAKYPGDEAIDPQFLDELRTRISKLREEAEHANLEPDLKAFIHRHLHSLEDGLALYKIKGADGLRESTFGVIGELVVRGSRGEFEADEAKLSYLRRVFGLVKDVLDIADKVQKVHRIAAQAGPYIVPLLDKLT